jgi:hypothetical protein
LAQATREPAYWGNQTLELGFMVEVLALTILAFPPVNLELMEFEAMA